MLPLRPPDIEPFPLYMAIIAAKDPEYQNPLRVLAPRVEGRYVGHHQALAAIGTFQPDSFTDEEKEVLTHCYTGSTAPLRELQGEIERLQAPEVQGRCQYCGLAPTDTFDHYLPQHAYPELSAHPLNLLPCCTACNRYKGKRIPTPTDRELLYLYVDVLPAARFLFARLEWLDGLPVPQFWVDTSGIPEPLATVIQNHLRVLHLPDRYRRQSAAEIALIRRTIHSQFRVATPALVQDLLKETEQTYAATFGSNHWRAVLMNALATDTSVVRFLCDPAA